MGDAAASPAAAPAPPPPIDALPDAVLTTLFECLPPVSVARLMTVCHRWHIVAGDDVLWRRLLRGALARCHPDVSRSGEPPAPPAAFYATSGVTPPPRRTWVLRQRADAAVAEAARAAEAAAEEDAWRRRGGDGDDGDDGDAGVAGARARARERAVARTPTPLEVAAAAAAAAASRALDAVAAAEDSDAAQCAAASESRAAVVAAARRAAAAHRCLRAAWVALPQLHTSRGGVYALRHEYVRRGVRDMWHTLPPDGLLACVYHRVLAVRGDGVLAYVTWAGPLPEAVRELRRAVAAWSVGVGGGSGGGTAAAPPPPPPPPPHHRLTLGARGGTAAPTVCLGWWRMEGTTLRMEIRGAGTPSRAAAGGRGASGPPGGADADDTAASAGGGASRSAGSWTGPATVWRCEVSCGAFPHAAGGTRVAVLSMALVEQPPAQLKRSAAGGGDGDDAWGVLEPPPELIPIINASDGAEFVFVPGLGVAW